MQAICLSVSQVGEEAENLALLLFFFGIVILCSSQNSCNAIGQAREQAMNEQGDALRASIQAIAERAIQAYAQGILSEEALAEQMLLEWQKMRKGDEQPARELLWRIAQRICSRALYSAWRSSDIAQRNQAFYNLRRYLEQLLRNLRAASRLRNATHAVDDIIHQVLEILLQEKKSGPDDPAAFLKWTQTILIRQVHTYQHKYQPDACVSLDAQIELFQDQLVNTGSSDPLEQVVLRELQLALGRAILSMRNPRYRLVLIYTFLVGVDEDEMARRLNVPVQDIYLWRHRALKALRRNPEIMNILRSMLE